jgi:origin recognition complex subunit 1
MERRRKGKEKMANVQRRGPTRPKRKIKREVSEENQIEAEEVTESDDGGTEDEYESQSDGRDDEDEGPSDSPTADEDDEDSDDVLGGPRTPSKKRKRSTVTHTYSKSPSKSIRTPSKRKVATTPTTTPRKPTKLRKTVVPTPHSRKSIATRKQKQKSLRVRPPPPLTSHLQLENLPTDPWLRAMHVLHVGARPDVLPCREEEYARCLRAVEELIEEGSGGCVCKFALSSLVRNIEIIVFV